LIDQVKNDNIPWLMRGLVDFFCNLCIAKRWSRKKRTSWSRAEKILEGESRPWHPRSKGNTETFRHWVEGFQFWDCRSERLKESLKRELHIRKINRGPTENCFFCSGVLLLKRRTFCKQNLNVNFYVNVSLSIFNLCC
jgi:hypothetical protein